MSSITNDQLKATGTAQVIAILESAPPPAATRAVAGGVALAAASASPQMAGLENYFVSQQGQNHELAAAGMSNVAACLEDGYSSAGTSGHGLGSVIRQSHFVDIGSWPGLGTAVLARVAPGKSSFSTSMRRTICSASRASRCIWPLRSLGCTPKVRHGN